MIFIKETAAFLTLLSIVLINECFFGELKRFSIFSFQHYCILHFLFEIGITVFLFFYLLLFFFTTILLLLLLHDIVVIQQKWYITLSLIVVMLE